MRKRMREASLEGGGAASTGGREAAAAEGGGGGGGGGREGGDKKKKKTSRPSLSHIRPIWWARPSPATGIKTYEVVIVVVRVVMVMARS
ncbi:hypothetical protein E2C01_095028 [Portunus trituberculatus]|uniref:Uncharacterized protein n=1 Tax=Portunus trituberculatus TaxID=210409 RepID=A0A5B7JU25_PORTR|nr:hypothetical protein [Portunus trituberculatus]